MDRHNSMRADFSQSRAATHSLIKSHRQSVWRSTLSLRRVDRHKDNTQITHRQTEPYRLAMHMSTTHTHRDSTERETHTGQCNAAHNPSPRWAQTLSMTYCVCSTAAAELTKRLSGRPAPHKSHTPFPRGDGNTAARRWRPQRADLSVRRSSTRTRRPHTRPAEATEHSDGCQMRRNGEKPQRTHGWMDGWMSASQSECVCVA